MRGISFERIEVLANSGDYLQNGMQIDVIALNPSYCWSHESVN